MRPFLFTIGSTRVPSFFFLIMVAALAAALFLFFMSKRRGLQPDVALDLGIIGVLSGVIGARIFHILVEAPSYYWEKPMRVFEFWRGGFVSWGGLIAVWISFLIYFRLKKLPVLIYFDSFATGAPIIKFIVRVACLLTGCCYGHPTDLPWAIAFTNPLSTAYYYFPNKLLHPTQIYSMIHAALLFVLVNWFYSRRKGRPGQTACVLAMGWSLPRAFIEFFRGDADRGVYLGGLFSTGQIMGLIVFSAALATYYYLLNRSRSSFI